MQAGAGSAQQRGPGPSQRFGCGSASGSRASRGRQAQGQSTQAALRRPQSARQEWGQAPEAFHGAGARRSQYRHPSPSCRKLAVPDGGGSQGTARPTLARARKVLPLRTGRAHGARRLHLTSHVCSEGAFGDTSGSRGQSQFDSHTCACTGRKAVCRYLKNLKIEKHEPVITILAVYPHKTKSLMCKQVCAPIYCST